jgi:uncharacterized protein (DUF305 family)
VTRRRVAGLVAVALLAGVAVGFSVDSLLDDEPASRSLVAASPPADASGDAGFARDMAVHHAQAVEMADIIRQRTGDEALLLLTTDIVFTQQSQIGRLHGWLEQWGLPYVTPRPPMEWAHTTHAGHSDGGMPGMASRGDVSSLRVLPVAEAEVRFLELMIEHHRGGVAMAEAALATAQRPEVLSFAEKVVAAQQAEIELLVGMLADRS